MKKKSAPDLLAIVAETANGPSICTSREARDEKIRMMARNRYAYRSSDAVEIDEGATVSEGDDNGAFVQAWVWVDFSETELDKETEVSK